MEAKDVCERMKLSINAFTDHCEEMATDALGQFWTWAERDCESEIEKMFLMAWLLKLEEYSVFGAACGGRAKSSIYKGNDPPLDTADFEQIEQLDLIWIQPKIEQYRADFVLRRVERHHITGVATMSPLVVIECDGHEFHERTKKQAGRDKGRDREIQTRGMYVMRFAGWEVWHQPAKCSDEVDDFMQEHIGRLTREARQKPTA